MSVKRTGWPAKSGPDPDQLKAFREMTEEEIERNAAEDPDSAPCDGAWENAVLMDMRPKVPVSLRLDPDIVEWFKSKGPGYQTRINLVLRAYVEAQRKREAEAEEARRRARNE